MDEEKYPIFGIFYLQMVGKGLIFLQIYDTIQ